MYRRRTLCAGGATLHSNTLCANTHTHLHPLRILILLGLKGNSSFGTPLCAHRHPAAVC